MRDTWRPGVSMRVLGWSTDYCGSSKTRIYILDVDVGEAFVNVQDAVSQAAWARNVNGYGSSVRDLSIAGSLMGCLCYLYVILPQPSPSEGFASSAETA